MVQEYVPFFLSIIQPIIWMGLFGRAMNISAIFTSTQISIPQINPPPTLPQQIQIEEAFSNVSKEIMEKTFGTADYFS